MTANAHTRILLAKSIFDEGTDLFYNLVTQADFSFGTHAHDFHELFLIVEGSAVHQVNGERHPVRQGMLVLIRPADIHSYEADGNGICRFLNLAFSSSVLEDLTRYLEDPERTACLLGGDMPPSIQLSPLDADALRRKLEGLALMQQTDKRRIRIHFRLLLADVLRLLLENSTQSTTFRLPWLEKLVGTMHEKSHFNEGLPALVRLSGKSQPYLCRIFRAELGKTPSEFVNGIRLNYAANLLAHSDEAVLDIALDAGFGNLSHFHHLFRSVYGQTPGAYRHARRKQLHH